MKINLKDYGITTMAELKNVTCKEGEVENPVISMLKKIEEEFQFTISQKDKEKSAATVEKIMRKLKAGKKLTAQEMAYLQRYAPELYEEARKVQIERRAFEEQIKHCKSKEEVMLKLGFKLKNIPEKAVMKEALINAYQDVVREFQKTEEYRKLPGTMSEKEAAAKGEVSVLQQAYSFTIFWNGFQDRIENVL